MVGAIKAGVKKGFQVFDNSAAGAAADAAEQQNLGRKFGPNIWAENLGRKFGQNIWAENLGRKFGQKICKRIQLLGRKFDIGHKLWYWAANL